MSKYDGLERDCEYQAEPNAKAYLNSAMIVKEKRTNCGMVRINSS